MSHALVYVRDLQSGRTRLVSRAVDGGRAEAEATQGSISADGRWVTFDSKAANLGADGTHTSVFRVGPVR